MRLRVSGRDRQQVEVVVAENGDRGVAQRLHFTQHGERVRSAVHEVADDPQPILARREGDQFQQLTELGVAALDVADCVQTHGRLLRLAQMC